MGIIIQNENKISPFTSTGPTTIPEPSIVSFYSKNCLTRYVPLTHTFTEGGTFQYIAVLRLGNGDTGETLTISKNGTPLSPSTDSSISTIHFYYGEVTVEAGDTIATQNNNIYYHSGLQLIILKNMDISGFNIIGFSTNDGSSFLLPNNKWILQVYQCGYYYDNSYKYRLERHNVKNDSTSNNGVYSIPTPSSTYYGFTYAVTVVSTNKNID